MNIVEIRRLTKVEYLRDPPETDEAGGVGSEIAAGLRPVTVTSGRRDVSATSSPPAAKVTFPPLPSPYDSGKGRTPAMIYFLFGK